MDIKQYYQQSALSKLNGSILACLLPVTILIIGILFSLELPLFVVVVPFLVISMFQYQGYYVDNLRSKECDSCDPLYDDVDFLSQNNLLIMLAPAPAVRMLLFTPDGMLAGEIKERRSKAWRWFLPYFLDTLLVKRFGIFDSKGKLLAQLVIKRNTVTILDAKGETAGVSEKKKNFVSLAGGKTITYQASFGEMYFHTANGLQVCTLKRGWLPLEWTRVFKAASTPVLVFDSTLSTIDRISVLALLSQHFEYHNH